MSDRVEVETLKVGQGGGRDLLADLYRPPNPNGCGVLLIYGGGFVEGDRRQLGGYGIALGRAGYTSLACEYRLAGEALWPAALDDVHTAFGFFHDEAKSLGLDDLEVGGVRQLGRWLSLVAARRHECTAGRRVDRLLRADGFPERRCAVQGFTEEHEVSYSATTSPRNGFAP